MASKMLRGRNKSSNGLLVAALVVGTPVLIIINLWPLLLVAVVVWAVFGIVNEKKKNETKQEQLVKDNHIAEILNRIDSCSIQEYPAVVAEIFELYHKNPCNFTFDDDGVGIVAHYPGGDICYLCYKSYENIGIAQMRKLVARLDEGNYKGRVIVANREFTPQAAEFANNANVILAGRAGLIAICREIVGYDVVKYDTDNLQHCPYCESRNIAFYRKGYDYNYAWWGSILGIKGSRYAAGFDRKRVMGHCNACGREWKTDKAYLT